MAPKPDSFAKRLASAIRRVARSTPKPLDPPPQPPIENASPGDGAAARTAAAERSTDAGAALPLPQSPQIAVRVLDRKGPRQDEPFVLIVDDGSALTGCTDEDGCIQAPISKDARKLRLILGRDERCVMHVIQLRDCAVA